MHIRFADADEILEWDRLVLASPDEGTVYRSQANIDGMKLQGYSPVHLVVDGQAVTGFTVRVPFLGTMWVLIGPPVTTAEDMVRAARALAQFAAAQNVSAVRMKTLLRHDPDSIAYLEQNGLHRTASWLEDHTVVVDLTGSEDEVAARFKKRARKSIHRAEREGVRAVRVDTTDENCRIFYGMLSATSGGRFWIPGEQASSAILQRYASSGNGQMFFAVHDGEVVASSFVTTFGENALYFGAGSVRKNPGDPRLCGLGDSRAAYALQWEAMKWAREQGCLRYDLDGTPASWNMADPNHPRKGVGQFKTAFAKDVVDYIGTYQISAKKISGYAIRRAEVLRGRLEHSVAVNRILGRSVRPNPDHVWLYE
ncbi:lipid II:glycine glycyltransferase FemX [Prescottella sp. R16]|uniref:lipid II:glycine glycyltransferase FemX n=1 Tax=Prescottella sp. R16 TaxID=3064529 RepID=UPI00272DC859|nr:peptidoglycan bridge formation glycyltransferase FemA/FemB family protein [Prescottella sp. R16]